MLANIQIKVVPHRSMNTRKGVMRCTVLAETSKEEIREKLSTQGITEVRKIKVHRKCDPLITGTIILTFILSVLPTSIKVKDDVYIPNPLHCVNTTNMDATECFVSESLPVSNVEQ